MERRDDGEEAENFRLLMSRKCRFERLLGLLLKESDEIIAVLGLLETTEGHLGAWDVLLWVLEVGKQSLLLPCNALLLVRVCVRETLDLTGLAAEETVQVGTNLVALAFL